MYLYYSIHTKRIDVTWETNIIEKCIEESNLFSKTLAGNYEGISFFCLLGLMKVKDWDCWNSNDYDCEQTNYISIITSEYADGIPKQSIEIMKKLSELLSEDVILEE